MGMIDRRQSDNEFVPSARERQEAATGAAAAKRGSSFAVGDLVAGRFWVVRYIASGGMGEVYEVEDRFLEGVRVALKTIRPEIAGDVHTQQRFKREVLLSRQVSHPNICPIYDIFRLQSGDARGLLPFLTMKLLPGETLAARLERKRCMPAAEAEPIIRQIAAGLQAAHSVDVVHRDIKSANIMLCGEGQQVQVWITDFGLARTEMATSSFASGSHVVGTLGYLAPELLRGQLPSKASDVYAFGMVVHEIFTGTMPDQHRRSGVQAPPPWDRLINGCLEANPQHRFPSVTQAMAVVDGRSETMIAGGMTRRTMIGLTAGASVVAAVSAWRGAPYINSLLSPLPERRFVALLAWPLPHKDDAAVLSTVLDSIGNRLARAEAMVKDLLVISSSDLNQPQDALAKPMDAVTSLGANLVLAASLGDSHLNLHLLDAASQRVLRQARIPYLAADLSSIADKGSSIAAKLLGLPANDRLLKDTEQLKALSPQSFKAFSVAEALAAQENDSGLDAAIQGYQGVLEKEPHFALGYARLSNAYTRKYVLTRQTSALSLAGNNASLSLHYNPASTQGLLSQAMVDTHSGRSKEAFQSLAQALKTDPANPEILLSRAAVYRDLGLLTEEESVYRDIFKTRPNYWIAHNQLGMLLWKHAKYDEAAREFEAASMIAPTVALPLANLGTMYLEMGKHDEAIDVLDRSLAKSPNEFAYLGLGDLAFSDRDYGKSLIYYQKARDLKPKYHLIWRNIGDCYAMLGNKSGVRDSYAKAAELLAEQLKTNPNSGSQWMMLAFYQAKVGDFQEARTDIAKAGARGATDVESQFYKAQALALMGEQEAALQLVIALMNKGLSQSEVDLALDLDGVRNDPRYLQNLLKIKTHKKAS
ncbi:MAG: protein kinase [Acidobacteriaceae bacterium]